MWELGKNECVHTDTGPEAAYWWGTEFSRMGGYDFPGQIAASDGSESNGAMGAGFIVLGNSAATGSIRVGRTEEGTDSMRAEMAALLEVLIGAKVTENLVVMVDNQSILREISRWVGEGGRTFLALSVNPDILRMVIGRLRMRIEQGTATILCKIKSHRRLSVMSGLSSNPANREIASSSGRLSTKTFFFSIFFQFFFSCIFSKNLKKYDFRLCARSWLSGN